RGGPGVGGAGGGGGIEAVGAGGRASPPAPGRRVGVRQVGLWSPGARHGEDPAAPTTPAGRGRRDQPCRSTAGVLAARVSRNSPLPIRSPRFTDRAGLPL